MQTLVQGCALVGKMLAWFWGGRWPAKMDAPGRR